MNPETKRFLDEASVIQCDLVAATAKLARLTASIRASSAAPFVNTTPDADDGSELALVSPRDLSRSKGYITPLPPDGKPVRAPFVPPEIPTVILERQVNDDFLRPTPRMKPQRTDPAPKPPATYSAVTVFLWLAIIAIMVVVFAPERVFIFIESLTR